MRAQDHFINIRDADSEEVFRYVKRIGYPYKKELNAITEPQIFVFSLDEQITKERDCENKEDYQKRSQ